MSGREIDELAKLIWLTGFEQAFDRTPTDPWENQSDGLKETYLKTASKILAAGYSRVAQSARRLEELEKFVISVREIIAECESDFNICPSCGHQDDTATKDSDLLLLLRASLRSTLSALPSMDSGSAA